MVFCYINCNGSYIKIKRWQCAHKLHDREGRDSDERVLCYAYELVKGIRDIEPECLCYIMQHANIGIDEIKKGKRDEERDGEGGIEEFIYLFIYKNKLIKFSNFLVFLSYF